MSADYFRRPLAQKLGIKRGQKIAILNAPEYYGVLLGEPTGSVIVTKEPKGKFDLIQIFARDTANLEKEFRKSEERIKQDGMIWVAWPKSSSKLPTDLGENAVREMGLRNGLVDVKICSIDETWSALKFVRRAEDRR